MRRLIVMSLLTCILMSSAVYAAPACGEALKQMNKGYNAASSNTPKKDDAGGVPAAGRRQEKQRKTYKSNVDEYRISSSGGSQSVRVSDTDDLHIYNNNYGQKRSYGSKQSTDEFHTAPVDIHANDGYAENGFDELHVNENYRQNVWQPDEPVQRLNGFDEFRLPSDM